MGMTVLPRKLMNNFPDPVQSPMRATFRQMSIAKRCVRSSGAMARVLDQETHAIQLKFRFYGPVVARCKKRSALRIPLISIQPQRSVWKKKRKQKYVMFWNIVGTKEVASKQCMGRRNHLHVSKNTLSQYVSRFLAFNWTYCVHLKSFQNQHKRQSKFILSKPYTVYFILHSWFPIAREKPVNPPNNHRISMLCQIKE